jgi:phage tail sheath protein FI
LHLGNQAVRAIPPSGHNAGIYSRTDAETGVHRAPANQELRWAQGLSVEVSGELQGVFNPIGINVARTFPGRGILLYGARTVSSDPSWRFVNVRRLFMMIEEAVEESTQWSVFEPNDLDLRPTLVLAISSFLEALWERGALVGSTPEEAFFVKCDDENNPSFITDLGQLIVDVGVAPVIPAEFVVFRIGKTERGLELTEAVG